MRWASVLLALILLGATAASVTAVTTTDLERRILGWVNDARADRGLVPLRIDTRLWSVAGGRAGVMAATNTLSHTVAGSLTGDLRGIRWYAAGEDIAMTSAAKGTYATADLFRLWKSSPAHWAGLMSSRYNYVGVGMAYRSANRRTYGSIVLIEGPDRTGARASMTGGRVSGGNDVRWSWTGYDPALQTHTAGLRDFTVQQRTDSGAWSTVATNTTSTSRTILNKAHGHWYGVRVRARDRVGNIGPWSAERRVWVS
jgi:hypothetical protein